MDDVTPDMKIALVGLQAVGKTCISLRFVSGTFSNVQASTSGAAFLRKSMNHNDKLVKFQIWDTAGQEKFRSLTSMYYRSAAVVIIVFDVTNRSSYEDVGYWFQEIKAKGSPGCLIYLVANKIDLEAERVITKTESEAFAETIGAKYMECSAQTGEGVVEIFQSIAGDQIKVYIQKKEDDINDGKINLNIKKCC